jgi:glycolate oxidase iron-sulfur subunit
MAQQLNLDSETYRQAQLCIHCGLCLPACPTYLETGIEAESPRGRIHLMKAMADGRIAINNETVQHLDSCLDCQGCETACPSGVVYHQLIEQTRHQLNHHPRGPIGWMIRHVLPYPARFKPLLKLTRWMGPLIRRFGPASTQTAVTAAAQATSGPTPAGRYSADAPNGKTVGLLVGCVGSLLENKLQHQTIALLRRFGCEVVVPEPQCCGAIPQHNGFEPDAKRMILANLDAFESVDAIVSTAAGCGAMTKQYGQVMAGTPDAARADSFAARARDISEWLLELDPPPPAKPLNIDAVYHGACHLSHAQHIVDAPRQLLERAGVHLLPLGESEVCCGAAGTYSMLQPKMSGDLAQRKVDAIERSGIGLCVTANIGCALQIKAEANRRDLALRVVHPVQLLAEAYGV